MTKNDIEIMRCAAGLLASALKYGGFQNKRVVQKVLYRLSEIVRRVEGVKTLTLTDEVENVLIVSSEGAIVYDKPLNGWTPKEQSDITLADEHLGWQVLLFRE